MVQEFINKQFYNLFLITLLFGVILYNPIGFESADELCALLLLLMFLYAVFKSADWAFNKVFLFTLFVFLFYTGYSFYIGSNTKMAILTDLIIQMKPYLAFFAVYYLKPVFSPQKKKLLKDISIVLWFILLPIGIVGFFHEHFIGWIMKHPTYYA
ncbi:O-antigen ligase domain-containing protein, partial [Parabacteroides sp. OttesenSCG-928-G07]|nr:O-antigen ligase domain-containing protein [Parabacteroides sp. OttesenSCG-928-G07]